MKHLFNLLIISLLSCQNLDLSVKKQSKVIDSVAIELSKKDIAILEQKDNFLFRIDNYVESHLPVDKDRNYYFSPMLTKKSIFFNEKSIKVNKDEYKKLSSVAKKIKKNSKLFILLKGHSYKESKVLSFNEHLSEARALAVKNALGSYGVTPQRIFTLSYGDKKPLDISKLKNKKIKTLNHRRVEIIFGKIKEK